MTHLTPLTYPALFCRSEADGPFIPEVRCGMAIQLSRGIAIAGDQREIGNPNYGCDLRPIDFVAFGHACGADGFRCERPEEAFRRPADAPARSGTAERHRQGRLAL